MPNQVLNFDTNPPISVAEYDKLIEMALPGYSAMQTMVLACLKSRLPETASVLVIGAGTGTELVTLGCRNPHWQLTGVDPSNSMLAQARQKVAQYNLRDRVILVQGYTENLTTTSLYDAATSILVMHFLPDDGSKLRFLRSISERLKPSASFVLVDVHGEKDTLELNEMIDILAVCREEMGMPLEKHLQTMAAFHQGVYPVSESRTLNLLQQAGFSKILRFYTGLWVGGWIATKV